MAGSLDIAAILPDRGPPGSAELEPQYPRRAACQATPDCRPFYGSRIAADLSCLDSQQFALCIPADAGCQPTEVDYRDPQGSCWWFAYDCIEGRVGWKLESPECPVFEVYSMLPECG